MPLTIRPLNAQDESAWRALWAGYLDFYETPDLDPEITAHTFAMLTGEQDDVFGLVAELDGRVVGIVNSVVHAATWYTQPICYLEDLFVDPAVRGQGAGRALIEAVVARAAQNGWAQVYWRTATTNPARVLYDQVGQVIDFVTYVRKLNAETV